MKRILFVSPLDRLAVPNTREQNIAAECRAMGHRTLSLTLAQNTSRAPWAVLRDSITCRASSDEGGTVLRIDPPFNPCTGLRSNLKVQPGVPAATPAAGEDRQAQSRALGSRPAGRRLRSALVSLIAPLGILRDVSVIPVFLVHALQRGRFDLCIAYGPWAACVGWALRACGRVGVVVYDDQDYEPAILGSALRRRWAATLERSMMRRADLVVSVGHRLAALRRSQTHLKVEVIPNGVQGSFAAQVRAAAPKTDADTDAAQTLTLVYVGNVVAWSGLDALLTAARQVRAAGQALRVLIIGDGLPAYVESLQAQARALGLEDVVRFVGRVPNHRIAEWLAQADVGLAHFRPDPYRRYAFPLKVVEYMAAGLAVIGTCDTETEDILERHGCGIAVAFDSGEIASAILRLGRDLPFRRECQARALQAAAGYHWEALASQQLALVERLESSRRRRTGSMT